MVAGGGEFLPGNGRGRESKGTNGGRVIRRGCVDLVGGVHQGSGDCGVESKMSWTEFKTFVTSRFIPEYVNIRAGVAWLDLRQTHSIKAYVGKFQGVVSTLQHMSNYNKQLKFIHGLQL